MILPVRSGVYTGWLRHRRTLPVSHAFTYPLFMVLLDIDRVADLMEASPFTSYNCWNWASFHESDHLGESTHPLRERLGLDAARQGLALPEGPIFLLTHLRYLGYCFNPVSFFYCYDGAGALRLVLAEVNNTFGGSHRYWLEPQESPSASGADLSEAWISGSRVFRATSTKAFYVSPFMPADMRYDFAFTEPGERLVAHMTLEGECTGQAAHAFDATLSLGFRPWQSQEIARALIRHPAMTMKVTAGIHWQALCLWLKGLPIVPRPTSTGVRPSGVASDAGRS